MGACACDVLRAHTSRLALCNVGTGSPSREAARYVAGFQAGCPDFAAHTLALRDWPVGLVPDAAFLGRRYEAARKRYEVVSQVYKKEAATGDRGGDSCCCNANPV